MPSSSSDSPLFPDSSSTFYGRRKWTRMIGRQPRVLIVEDSRDIFCAVAKWFADDGWKARGVHDGSAFFDITEQVLAGRTSIECDAIIADISMPGIDVVPILEGLRQVGSSIPIVVISALPDPELPGRIEDLGRSQFFAKPFSIETLLRTTRQMLLTNCDDSRHH